MSKVSKELADKLRAERARLRALAEQELQVVREHVRARLTEQGDTDLVDCPVVEQTVRRLHRLHALDLPENWEKRIPKYVADVSKQNAFARQVPPLACQFTAAQLRPLARVLIHVRTVRAARRGAP